jgi:hypothetical protein
MTGFEYGQYNEKSKVWKGDKVGINALHRWINTKFRKVNQKCEMCGSGKNIQAANIGGYDRNPENWLFVCASCHYLLHHPKYSFFQSIADK